MNDGKYFTYASLSPSEFVKSNKTVTGWVVTCFLFRYTGRMFGYTAIMFEYTAWIF